MAKANSTMARLSVKFMPRSSVNVVMIEVGMAIELISTVSTYSATLADGKPNPAAVNANLAANIDPLIHQGTLWLEQLKAIGILARDAA